MLYLYFVPFIGFQIKYDDDERNKISTIRKKIFNLQGLPYMRPNFVNFGLETAENGWRVLAHPLNFCIGRLPALSHGRYITDSSQTLAHVM